MERITTAIICLVLLCVAISVQTRADEWNKKTIVTFDHAVEIPGGVVLPAGRYVFKLLDAGANPTIVQIFNADETHLYTTVEAIKKYRLEPTDKTVMSFAARSVGSPQAIKAWFYPGANWGLEFVYPKNRVVKVAKIPDHQAPVAAQSKMASTGHKPARPKPKPRTMAAKNNPPQVIQPMGKNITKTEITVWGPPKPGTVVASDNSANPATAVDFPRPEGAQPVPVPSPNSSPRRYVLGFGVLGALLLIGFVSWLSRARSVRSAQTSAGPPKRPELVKERGSKAA
ncbi:MAG: hypothetical protein NVS1B11_27830 [Terriglobales bacterium]